MEKITIAHIYASFIRLANALNRRVYIPIDVMNNLKKKNQYFPEPRFVANSYDEIGSWYLDYAHCYGGWNIVQVHNENRGIDHPLGSRRYKNTQFYDILNYSANAVSLKVSS